MFCARRGLVIITGGIDLSVGSMFALLGVIFVDLLVTYAACPGRSALLIVVAGRASCWARSTAS